MGPFEKVQRQIESRMMTEALEKAGAPEKVIRMIACLIENGCPADALINGIKEFVQRERATDRKELSELLKDMPFEVVLEEDEGNE